MLKNLALITIVMIAASACGAVKRIPQEELPEVGRLSFSPEMLANALQTGWQITGEWDEYVEINPSQGPDDPASGWIITDIDGDGNPEHLFPKYELQAQQDGKTFKLVLVSLYVKYNGKWEKADFRTLEEINTSKKDR